MHLTFHCWCLWYLINIVYTCCNTGMVIKAGMRVHGSHEACVEPETWYPASFWDWWVKVWQNLKTRLRVEARCWKAWLKANSLIRNCWSWRLKADSFRLVTTHAETWVATRYTDPKGPKLLALMSNWLGHFDPLIFKAKKAFGWVDQSGQAI